MKVFKTKLFNSVGIVFLVGLVIEINFPGYVWACRTNSDSRPLRPTPMTARSAMIERSSTLGEWSGTAVAGYWANNCPADTTISVVLMPNGVTPVLTTSEEGVDYNVYPTGTENIGYYLRARDHLGNTSDFTGNYTRTEHARRDINIQVRFIATGPLAPGTYRLRARSVGTVLWELMPGRRRARGEDISYRGTTVLVTGVTCSVLAADRNQQVVLPTVSRSSFQGVGSTAGSKRFTIGVNCDAGVALHATMTDANFPDNRGDFLRLAEDSTAAGVGLQISATGRAGVVSYGPDSRIAGTQNQWFVGGNAASLATEHIIPFTVRYVQTAAAVQPGTVHARSTITFSYQ
ncbi:fimbrial protein [Pseudomonas sp. Irchel s3b6]|uniref:fimbrial protein n=1 Tax=Pseudomonas sp. Irchel s3b6 TaxID=2009078 RepID=UPI000BA48F0E|nr:fimbrial protein [Pseudomonas sp. Irchel s3b6]